MLKSHRVSHYFFENWSFATPTGGETRNRPKMGPNMVQNRSHNGPSGHPKWGPRARPLPSLVLDVSEALLGPIWGPFGGSIWAQNRVRKSIDFWTDSWEAWYPRPSLGSRSRNGRGTVEERSGNGRGEGCPPRGPLGSALRS